MVDSKRRRVLWLMLLAAMLLAGTAFRITMRQLAAVLVGEDPRVAAFAAEVESESLEYSIARLAKDNDAYFLPGYYTARKFDQVDLEQMLSNLRCVKILDELGRLPEEARETRCGHFFDDVLRRHADALRRALRHREDPSFPPNTQSIAATRFAVCAALWASAQHASPDRFFDELDRLDEFRDEIDSRIERNRDRYPADLIAWVRTNYVPDPRFQLNALLALAARLRDKQETIAELIERECPGLNRSHVSISSIRVRTPVTGLCRWVVGPIGREKHYSFYRWPDSMDFDLAAQERLIARIRGALFTPGNRPLHGLDGRRDHAS